MVRTLRFHMQGALVRDLGSHRPSGAAKKKKKKSQVETLFPHVMVLGGRALDVQRKRDEKEQFWHIFSKHSFGLCIFHV